MFIPPLVMGSIIIITVTLLFFMARIHGNRFRWPFAIVVLLYALQALIEDIFLDYAPSFLIIHPFIKQLAFVLMGAYAIMQMHREHPRFYTAIGSIILVNLYSITN